MTQRIIVLGDPIKHGEVVRGRYAAGDATKTISGLAKVKATTTVTCSLHGVTQASAAASIVKLDGVRVVRDGDLTDCGATVVSESQAFVYAD